MLDRQPLGVEGGAPVTKVDSGMDGGPDENDAFEEDDNRLDPDFAERFERDPRRPACQLYLISPPRIDEGFADRLAAVLEDRPGRGLPASP